MSKSVFKNKWTFTHDIKWKLNENALAEASRTDGIIPLVTNTAFHAADVLKRYKNQPFLEKRMYTKKTVLEVAPVFLKKVTRIEAMLFLYFVALMIVSLIERKIRMNMAKNKIEVQSEFQSDRLLPSCDIKRSLIICPYCGVIAF